MLLRVRHSTKPVDDGDHYLWMEGLRTYVELLLKSRMAEKQG